MPDKPLTHIDQKGRARMVNVSDKLPTKRTARAAAKIWMDSHTLDLLKEKALPKGDVLAVARVAGIMAAKETARLVPMCHPLNIEHVSIEFDLENNPPGIAIQASVSLNGKTGVEMEALTAASGAALTIYDMCKAVDKNMIIGDICVTEKHGGRPAGNDRKRPDGNQQVRCG